ncbi:MAG: hypothetical protein IJB70_11860 [Clostridia bacterium]|nr:hypothetical protein [Clostridia bacterium]
MVLLRSGSDKNGDCICAKRFSDFIINNIIPKYDMFSENELSYIKHLIEKVLELTLKIRNKIPNTEAIEQIIFDSKLLLAHPTFNNIFSRREIHDNPVAILRNKYILKLFRISEELCESLKMQYYAFECDDISDLSKNWGEKDVLVGTLKNREQLNVCLRESFYHAPKERVGNRKIKYIAIYQSKNLFGNYGGIYYWGRVLKTEVLKRSDITQIPKKSSELYYKYTIDKWYKLNRPIKSSSEGYLFGYTNLFMLFRAREIYQLYFKDYDEYKFFASLSLAISEKYNNVSYCYKDTNVYIKDGALIICKNEKIVFGICLSDYCKNMSYHWERIKQVYNKLNCDENR